MFLVFSYNNLFILAIFVRGMKRNYGYFGKIALGVGALFFLSCDSGAEKFVGKIPASEIEDIDSSGFVESNGLADTSGLEEMLDDFMDSNSVEEERNYSEDVDSNGFGDPVENYSSYRHASEPVRQRENVSRVEPRPSPTPDPNEDLYRRGASFSRAYHYFDALKGRIVGIIARDKNGKTEVCAYTDCNEVACVEMDYGNDR
jgi:hypothetical protein